MAKKTDYAALKQKLSEFLSGFTTVDDNGRKHFKYAEQLTNLAHRYPTVCANICYCSSCLLSAYQVLLDCMPDPQ